MTEINLKPPTEPNRKAKVHLSPGTWRLWDGPNPGRFLRDSKGMSIVLWNNSSASPWPLIIPTRSAISPSASAELPLQRHEDGLKRCVGCGLCSVVCPSTPFIWKRRKTHPASGIHGECYASYHQIDMLRCIFCGFVRRACRMPLSRDQTEAASTNGRIYLHQGTTAAFGGGSGKTCPGMTWLSEQEAVTHPVSPTSLNTISIRK